MSADLQVLTRENLGDKWYTPLRDLSHFRSNPLIPVFGYEMRAMIHEAPIAFARQGDTWLLVGVCGVEAGRNLLIGPRGGWITRFPPEYMALHPFEVMATEDGEAIPCYLGDASNLVEQQGRPLWDEAGEPTAALVTIRKRLQRRHVSRTRVAELGASLEAEGLLVPWELEGAPVFAEAQLHRLDQETFRTMPAELSAALLANGQLDIAYGHLFSSHLARRLVQRSKAPQQQPQAAQGSAEPFVLSDPGEVEAGFNFDID